MTIFAIVMILVVGVVTFFHLLQGFFSSAISAVLTIVAAVLALSYHEAIAQKYLAGSFADLSYTFSLLGMFALIYLVGRTIFDKAVPGNLRLPPAAEKIGGAVMGIVAGVFTAGIIAIAAQEMPFRGSIWGYARLSVDDSQVNVPTQRRAVERTLYDNMNDNTMDEAKRSGTVSMLVPVDEILIGETKKLSEGGSLSGATELSRVHPDWLTELFGQRMGLEPGAKRTAINDEKLQQVKVDGVYALKTGPDGGPLGFRALDSEFTAFRSKKLALPKDPTKDPTNRFFVLRVTFDPKAADRTGLIRVSPANVRLVSRTTPAGATEPQWTDFYPVGTLDMNGAPTGQKGVPDHIPTIFLNKADDFIFVNERSDKLNGQPPAVDFVFFVDANGFIDGGKKALDNGKAKIADGVFLEVKRMATVDLSGVEVRTDLKATNQTTVLRKEMAIEDQMPKAKAPTGSEVDPIEQRAAAARAEAAAAAAARKPSAGALSPTAQKLVGRWSSVKGSDTITLEFDNNKLKMSRAGAAHHDEIEGPWKEVSASGDNITIHADFPRKPQDMVFKFETNDSLQMQDGTEWTRFDRK
jgi:hypothetical protein